MSCTMMYTFAFYQL